MLRQPTNTGKINKKRKPNLTTEMPIFENFFQIQRKLQNHSPRYWHLPLVSSAPSTRAGANEFHWRNMHLSAFCYIKRFAFVTISLSQSSQAPPKQKSAGLIHSLHSGMCWEARRDVAQTARLMLGPLKCTR